MVRPGYPAGIVVAELDDVGGGQPLDGVGKGRVAEVAGRSVEDDPCAGGLAADESEAPAGGSIARRASHVPPGASGSMGSSSGRRSANAVPASSKV